jgi:hypothetical protein
MIFCEINKEKKTVREGNEKLCYPGFSWVSQNSSIYPKKYKAPKVFMRCRLQSVALPGLN